MTNQTNSLKIQDAFSNNILNKKPHQKTLESLTLIVVDNVLQQVFKKEGKNIIYNFLAENFQLEREEIPDKPEIFSTGLKKLLGSGALVIERMILHRLYIELGLKLEFSKNLIFSDQISELR